MPSPKKAYIFVLNNYTEDELQSVYRTCENESRYAIVGREVGESGTPHLQGYIMFARAYRFKSVKDRFFPRCHIEVAAGSIGSNIKYCSKDGEYREFGERPTGVREGGTSSRGELAIKFRDAMDAGRDRLDDFAAEEPGTWYYSGHNLLRNYVMLKRPIDRPNIEVLWIYGPPGSGKSRKAHEMYPNAYIKEPRTKWWSGYQFEEDVIIDDFGPNGIDINHLLRWFDRYKCLVESKGGMIALYAFKFVVTSNFHPCECFKDSVGNPHVQIPALERRIVIELLN